MVIYLFHQPMETNRLHLHIHLVIRHLHQHCRYISRRIIINRRIFWLKIVQHVRMNRITNLRRHHHHPHWQLQHHLHHIELILQVNNDKKRTYSHSIRIKSAYILKFQITFDLKSEEKERQICFSLLLF